jgi:Uma2 family endonuclease
MGSQGSEALTLEAFLALCEAAPEGVRYEAVGGQAVMMSGPTSYHQVAIWRLGRIVDDALPAGTILVAPHTWVLWEVPKLTLRQPDLVVITQEQLAQNPLRSAPILVVEALSPTTRTVDLRLKREEYARAGAAHYWLVDHEVPSVEALVLDPVTGAYRTAGLAKGDEVLSLTSPFPVSVAPSDLVAKGGGPWAPRATRH